MTHVQIKGSSYFFHFNCHQLKYGKYCIIINRPSHQHRFSTHESDMNGRKCLYKDRNHPIKSTRNQLDNHRGTPDTHHRLCFEKAKKMSGKKWVILVAGSKNWENYQHQANVCSLYQIIRKHGIPDEHIVVMMYDDIANNPENPTKGTIVSVADDTDVYSGVPKDYTGKDVTPLNFLAALQGDESTNKKVIKSGAKDNIYIYMTGLGTEGTFEFPEKSLYRGELFGAINNMQFSKMVIFMTSSYSATMFEDLSCNVDAFALTACDRNVQSCPSDYDETRKIYRSDKFSSAWIKFINEADCNTASFQKLIAAKQANYLKQNTGPCPCQFGNTTISYCHLSEFLSE